LEDNDDGDDTPTGKCGWVLSIRDKLKVFKPEAATLTPLRALMEVLAKSEVGKDATDAADATTFCICCCIYQKQTLAARYNNAFCGSCCCCNCTLQMGCNFYRIKTQLNNCSNINRLVANLF
jgi:hypothetical protein